MGLVGSETDSFRLREWQTAVVVVSARKLLDEEMYISGKKETQEAEKVLLLLLDRISSRKGRIVWYVPHELSATERFPLHIINLLSNLLEDASLYEIAKGF